MTKRGKLLSFLAAAVLLIAGGAVFLPRTVASGAETAVLKNPRITTEFSTLLYPGDVTKDVTSSDTVTAELDSSYQDREDIKIYHAISYEENQTGEWYRAEGLVYQPGKTAVPDIKQKNVSVVFIAAIPVKEKDGALHYSDFSAAELFSACSQAIDKRNFFCDPVSPKISIKDGTGYTVLGENAPSGAAAYCVNITLRFSDASLSSGIHYVEIDGYRKDRMIYEAKDLSAGGELKLWAVDPASIVYDEEEKPVGFSLGVKDVKVKVFDNAGNTTSARFKIGFPDYVETPLTYGEKQELMNEYSRQKAKYFFDAEEQVYPNYEEDILKPIDALIDEDMLLINAFNEYRPSFTDFNVTEENAAVYISDIETWCERYQAVLNTGDTSMKNAVATKFAALQDYVKKYREKRYTSSGVFVELPCFSYDTIEQLTEKLGYRAQVTVLTNGVWGFTDYAAALKEYSDKGTLIAAFEIKIMDGVRDATAEFSEVAAKLTVKSPDSLYNIDKVTPILCLYKDNTFLPAEGSFGLQLSVLDVNLSQTVIIYNIEGIENGFLYYFLTIGVPTIVVLILAAAVILLILIYRRRSKKPDEKLESLKIAVEKQKTVADIARKAREAEEALNRKHMEEIEKERQDAIEKVKAEHRKKFADKEQELRDQAAKREAELREEELKTYQMLALQKSKKLSQKELKKQEKKDKKPPKQSKKTGRDKE